MAGSEARVSPEMSTHQATNGHRNEEDYAKTVFGGKHQKGKLYTSFHLYLSHCFLQPAILTVSNVFEALLGLTIAFASILTLKGF